METFLLNLLKTSLLGSLAILAMLVLKPLWRERYRAKTRCWLWLALAEAEHELGLPVTEAQLAQLRGTALAPGEVYTGFPPKDS